MQALQAETSKLVQAACIRRNKTVVTPESAFIIDEVNLYERLGIEVFIKLSTEFYNRVYSDTENPDFLKNFEDRNKDESIRNQYEFFSQRMGGPPLFSQRKGHPALIGRHNTFSMTVSDADRWLEHMEQALDATPEIDPDSRNRMENFFTHTAYFLVAGLSPKK